jgi:hypothetical protein
MRQRVNGGFRCCQDVACERDGCCRSRSYAQTAVQRGWARVHDCLCCAGQGQHIFSAAVAAGIHGQHPQNNRGGTLGPQAHHFVKHHRVKRVHLPAHASALHKRLQPPQPRPRRRPSGLPVLARARGAADRTVAGPAAAAAADAWARAGRVLARRQHCDNRRNRVEGRLQSLDAPQCTTRSTAFPADNVQRAAACLAAREPAPQATWG